MKKQYEIKCTVNFMDLHIFVNSSEDVVKKALQLYETGGTDFQFYPYDEDIVNKIMESI